MRSKAVIIPLIIIAIGILGTFLYTKYRIELIENVPLIYNPRDLNPEMVPEHLRNKGIGHSIGEFSFLDQNGQKISLEDVRGKIFVAEYFFTTCKTICPVMNNEMKRVQEQFKGKKDFKILSFTVDPEVDDVKTMKEYAETHNAIDNQWYFITGDKKELYDLARNSFFVLKPAEARNLGDAGSDFIHTNNFVLVDKELHIRGYYDGTSRDEVDEMMKDIEFLLKNS